MVPEGWHKTTLGEIAEIRRGASPRPIQDPRWFAEKGPGWIRIGDVSRSSRTLRATEQYLSAEGASRSVRVAPGDLILSIAGSIGKPIVVGIDACIHDGFVLFSNLDANVVSTDFIYYFLQSRQAQLSDQGQPGTQKNINTSIVGATELNLPPLNEQRKVAAILSSVDDAIEKAQAVVDELQAVKKAMMQTLLTGEIRVTPDPEPTP